MILLVLVLFADYDQDGDGEQDKDADSEVGDHAPAPGSAGGEERAECSLSIGFPKIDPSK